MSSRALTIIVPAYNEAQRLHATLDGVVAAASNALGRYEEIIVNDGSSDDTARIADGLAARWPHVSAIHHPVNRGVGAAYRSGLQAARYPFISLVPGDNAFQPGPHSNASSSMCGIVSVAAMVFASVVFPAPAVPTTTIRTMPRL